MQLLVRFGDRVGAQLIATGVQDAEHQQLLARSGVELFCGEHYARSDTRLPSCVVQALRLAARRCRAGAPVWIVTRLRPLRFDS